MTFNVDFYKTEKQGLRYVINIPNKFFFTKHNLLKLYRMTTVPVIHKTIHVLTVCLQHQHQCHGRAHLIIDKLEVLSVQFPFAAVHLWPVVGVHGRDDLLAEGLVDALVPRLVQNFLLSQVPELMVVDVVLHILQQKRTTCITPNMLYETGRYAPSMLYTWQVIHPTVRLYGTGFVCLTARLL